MAAGRHAEQCRAVARDGSFLARSGRRGETIDGDIFPFAQNTVTLNGERNGLVGDFTGSEWAGACYGPDGRWLFANIQSPGITFAITGPWGAGAL